MAVIQIIQLGADSSLDQHTSSTTLDDKIKKITKALEGVKNPQHFVLGIQIQDKNAIQLTSERTGVEDSSDFETFIKSVSTACGEPRSIFHVSLDRPAFGANGPATANVVEYVQVSFPTSLATPEFQRKIEGDFSRFEEIFRVAAKGDLGLAVGWVLEEQEVEEIEGENAKCFFVVRGWESMERFEESVRHDAYTEAAQILFAWNAPFKMVGFCFVVQRISGD